MKQPIMGKKTDVFEYMPDKVGIKHEDDCHLHTVVLGLLRRQHAAYVRMVKRMQREIEEGPDPEHPINRAHHLAYANLLAALTRYRRGGTR